jgi:hypothetical protein
MPPACLKPSVTFGEAGPATDPASSAYAGSAAYRTFTSQFAGGGTLASIKAALGTIPFSAPQLLFAAEQFRRAGKPPSGAPNCSARWIRMTSWPLPYTGNHGYDQAMSNTWANSFLLLASNGLNKYYGTNFGGATPLPTAAPDPRFLTITQVLTAGYSNYDAMSVQLRHAMKWGFQGQLGWTWSHGLGDSTVYNPYNLHFGYGNESIDVRHAVVSDLVWTEPHKFSLTASSMPGAGRLEFRLEVLRLYGTAHPLRPTAR